MNTFLPTPEDLLGFLTAGSTALHKRFAAMTAILLVMMSLNSSLASGQCSTPPPTGSGSQTFCSLADPKVSDLSATGTAIQWYDAATAGNLLAGTTSLIDGMHYYASQTIGCESETRLDVVVAISTQPTASAGGSETICPGEDATVSGASSADGTISWTYIGAGTLANANLLNPTYSSAAGDAGTTVTLTLHVTNAPCTEATATYTIIVRNITATPVITTPFCANVTTDISGTSSEANGTPVTVYVGGIPAIPNSETTVTGGTWTLTGVDPILDGQPVTAIAAATGKCISAVSAAVSPVDTWTGAVDTDANKAANWSCGVVPSFITDVLIPAVANQPVLSSDLSMNNITFTGASTISIGNNNLQILGTVTGSGSNFIGSPISTLTISGTAGTIDFATGSTNNYLKDLLVNAASSMTIGSNGLNITAGTSPGTLTVDGTLTTGGNLTLKSDDNGTARVGISSGSINGNVNVERYMPSRRAWALVTAPVRNSGSIWTNWQNAGVPNGTTGVNIWSPGGTNPPGANGLNLGPNYSMKGYNAAANTWGNTVTNTTTTLLSTNLGANGAAADNKSFLLFATNPFDNSGTNITPPNSAATTLSAKGSLQQGDQSFTLTNNTYNLVGNPYASPLDFAALKLHNTGIQDRFWLYEATIAPYGGYKLVYNDGGIYRIVPTPFVPDPSDPTADDYRHLQSGQAIFVEPTGAGTLVFSESDKSSPSTSPDIFFTSLVPAEELAVNLYKNNQLVDGVLAFFDSRYSTSVIANEDVQKIYNDGTNLGIENSNNGYTIEARPDISSKDTTRLWFWNSQANQSYKFVFKADHFNPAVRAYFEDAYTGGRTAISLLGDISEISFQTTGDAASQNLRRFRIVYALAGPLPISFTEIKAMQQAANVRVDWKVGSEYNADHYEVEYSTDGVNFNSIASVRAKGNNNSAVEYSYVHTTPVNGLNYYRIRQVEVNSDIKYSIIVRVLINDVKNNTPGISVYPNPGTVSNAAIELQHLAAGNYQLRIIGSKGEVISVQNISHAGGTASRQLKLPEFLPAGIYRVQLVGEDNRVYIVSLTITGK